MPGMVEAQKRWMVEAPKRWMVEVQTKWMVEVQMKWMVEAQRDLTVHYPSKFPSLQMKALDSLSCKLKN
jgi:hypothetical protein